MSDRKVTMTDIARLSDASPTTVSLVLRDKPGISPETRDRVLAAAHSLGYRHRASRTGSDTTGVRNVAMLLRARSRNELQRPPGVNPFYSWVLTGLEAQARAARMNLIYAHLPVDDHNEVIDIPHHLMDQPLAGAIIVGPFSDASIDAVLGTSPVDTVLVDAPSQPRRLDVIATDNENGAWLAVRHLIDHGHRDIGLIAPDSNTDPNFRQRADGYHRALRESEFTAYHGRIVADDVGAAVEELLSSHPDVTAIFCVNDTFAADAIAAAKRLGREVPRDLSVIGFDDTDHASRTGPPLTTMAVDKVGMGRLAIQMLEYRIAWPESAATLTTLTPRLVRRNSVAFRKDR
jgi:DNA-binding LacI/PurR family transcriptional regulator